MKLTSHLSIIKRFVLGAVSIVAIGLLAACGGYGSTATQNQNAFPPAASSAFGLTQDGLAKYQAGYPDPNDQKDVPESVKVTGAGETVLLRASVTEGYQIYECQASTTDKSGYAWKLQAPFAALKTDEGTNIIHSTGPTWLYTLDSSEVRAALGKFTDASGKMVPASATPDSKSVAWLRLDVTEHHGKDGLMSKVDQIQRLYTRNGVAPTTGCNKEAASRHALLPVSYSAEYVFWGHKG